jgi:hypothetical protein
MTAPNQAESNALAVVDQTAPYQTSSLMLNPQLMTQMMAVAQAMSEATITVPVHFRGKPGDCLAVVMQATQWNMNPFAVAQKTHVVNGTLGYEAQLVHAVLQATGAIEGTFHYEYKGTGNLLECRVGAVCKGDKDITWNEWLSIANVTTKNSPLWKTNPPQQMGYLQVKNWARAFKPGAILGVYTTEELLERPEKFMGDADVVGATPAGGSAATTATTTDGYPAEKFEQNFAQWEGIVQARRKTHGAMIAFIEAKGQKLSEEQKARINSIKVPQADTFTAPTFAEVVDKIAKAKTRDELTVAGDLIRHIADTSLHAEAQAKFDAREHELTQ